ncbi:MAG: hypothetical protein SGI77_05300, partial [Pirellulaceae bacterium]|nr:hypothetical protein [Pirellulaceae bacterium]
GFCNHSVQCFPCISRLKSIADHENHPQFRRKSHKTKLELINGIYRVTSISLEIQDVGPDYASLTKKYASDTKKSQQGMLLTTIGTVDIEWLQFNNDSLKFPTTEDLGSERRTWAKFLKLSTDDLAKDNAVNKPSDLR